MPTKFAAFAEGFLRRYLAAHPTEGSYLGLHEYDGRVPDYSQEAIAARVAALQADRAQLEFLFPDPSDVSATLDYHLIANTIEVELFQWQELQDWRRNPMFYHDALDVSNYIKRSYAPLADRVRALIRHEEAFSDLLSQIRTNLEASVPRPFVETALEVYDGTVTFLRKELPDAISALDDLDLLARFEKVNAQAADAVEQFSTYLREELLPRAHNRFAIGPEKYRKLLRYGEMVDMPLNELLRIGETDLARNRAAFVKIAAQIAPGMPSAEVVKLIAQDHPTEQSLIPDTAAMLDDLRQFIQERQIVNIPSQAGCRVAETPAFWRWAFAMMDSPGPFEQVATEAFYYITPPEPDWSLEDKEAWLSKLDYHTLRDVSIHEAYPGHYVHSLHVRHAPTDISKAFGAYSFWEGWAHYAEQMMLEEGYRQGDLKLRLAQLSEALVRDSRFVVAIRMHTQGMTVDEATRFIAENSYMAELPARKEAVRGTFDPGYLNYTLGKLMLLKLREDYKREKGSAFDLREFHERFLSFGAPPIPLVRRFLLSHNQEAIL